LQSLRRNLANQANSRQPLPVPLLHTLRVYQESILLKLRETIQVLKGLEDVGSGELIPGPILPIIAPRK
jgi:hypothetical protein